MSAPHPQETGDHLREQAGAVAVYDPGSLGRKALAGVLVPLETGLIVQGDLAGAIGTDILHSSARELFNDIADGLSASPFGLAGRGVGGVATYMTVIGFGVRQQARQAELAGEKPEPAEEISLEAARKDPSLILRMIQTAPLTEFHRRILDKGKVAAFEDTMARYYKEGAEGLWTSLKLTGKEITAAIRRGISARKVKRTNKHRIAELRFETEFPPSGNVAGIIHPEVMKYIGELNQQYMRGQVGYSAGQGSILPDPITRERLERYAQAKLGFDAGRKDAIRRPGMVGANIVADIMGSGSQLRADRRVTNPQALSLVGLEFEIKALWAERRKQHLIKNPAEYMSGVRPTEISDRLEELEALDAALRAKNALLDADKTGRDDAMLELVQAIGGMEEEVRGSLQPSDRFQDGASSFLELSSAGYTPADFRKDILIAGAARRVIKQIWKANGETEFDIRMVKLLTDRLSESGGMVASQDSLGSLPAAASVLSPSVRARMVVGDYRNLIAQALQGLTGGGDEHGARDAVVEHLWEQLTAIAAAMETDREDRYGAASSIDERQRGDRQREKDFPGNGRLLVYYGSMRPEDNEGGVLEAISISGGMFDNIDSAGNSPLRGTMLAKLKKLAAQSKTGVVVNDPFRVIPPEYRCEMAHFLGRLPERLTAENILNPVIANGLATLEVEPNGKTDIIEQIKNSTFRKFDYKVVPTKLVRFLQAPNGLLKHQLGHEDPTWNYEESTLVIFFRKEDGTENDLYQAFMKQADQMQKPELKS